MKVAVIVNELNIRGGTHKQVLRFCEYLDSHNIEFKLLTKVYVPEKTYPEFKKYSPVSLYDSEADFKKERNLFKKIRNTVQFMRKIPKDYDVINVHDAGLGWMTLLATWRKNTKTIWQINDLPSCFKVGVGARHGESRKDKVLRCFYRYLAKRLDAITVNVTKNKERVETCMGKSASVFYCGVDTNPALEKHEYAKTEKKQISMLSTGVFFSYRNYETLVLVVECLRRKHVDIRLDIIGSTERDKKYSERILNLIKEKNLGNHIKVWGQVDETTYNMLYNQADVFAFVNIDQSWGLTVFEAMSAGIPTIVSNSVGAIELLHNDVDAIIVEPTDVEEIVGKIEKLIEDKEYYNRISDNAFQAVKHYTWDELYSSKMVMLFHDLLQK